MSRSVQMKDLEFGDDDESLQNDSVSDHAPLMKHVDSPLELESQQQDPSRDVALLLHENEVKRERRALHSCLISIGVVFGLILFFVSVSHHAKNRAVDSSKQKVLTDDSFARTADFFINLSTDDLNTYKAKIDTMKSAIARDWKVKEYPHFFSMVCRAVFSVLSVILCEHNVMDCVDAHSISVMGFTEAQVRQIAFGSKENTESTAVLCRAQDNGKAFG